jgi:hypothetical protein
MPGPQQQANAQSAVPAYKVGYGRPPIEHQFKPGESRNPRGRPAGRKNNKTIFAQILRETIAVREGTKSRKMSKCEALLQAQTLKGIKGDTRSANLIIGLATRLRLLGDEPTNDNAKPDDQSNQIGTVAGAPPRQQHADIYFEGVVEERLTRDEQIEMSRLANELDKAGDIVEMDDANAARFRALVKKGRGMDVPDLAA